MKKFDIKSIVLGIIISSIAFATVVYATGLKVIHSNDALKIIFNGKEINLTTKPVLMGEDGSSDAKIYVPLREFFESIGFIVKWDNNTKTANVSSRKDTLSKLISPNDIDISMIKQKWIDVPYANVSPTQKLDIYLPNSGDAPYPVIISIHGGGFAYGSKTDADLKFVLVGVERGYAVVSIDYRLSSEAIFPAQIKDVKAAIRFIRANATKYNLDANKIAVCGGSAGGGLSALAGTSGDFAEFKDEKLGNVDVSDKVQAVVDLYGPVNYFTMEGQFKESGINGQSLGGADSFESKLMGTLIKTVPNLIRKANPETYISNDDPPFFIQHGTVDNMVPYQQSVDFASKLKSVLGENKVDIEILEGVGHGDDIFSSAENIKKMLDFLDKVLK